MLSQVLQGYEAFVFALLAQLGQLGIERKELLDLDHLCYRVETLEAYNQLKAELSRTETLIDESEINGRPIAVFQLNNPLVCEEFTIRALELPAPSATPYREGLEHAEFIVEDLDQFMARHWDMGFITKDRGKEINPEIAVKLPSGAAKFHLKPLLEVVELQRFTGKL
jgi:predicted metalloenzyme YecM